MTKFDEKKILAPEDDCLKEGMVIRFGNVCLMLNGLLQRSRKKDKFRKNPNLMKRRL